MADEAAYVVEYSGEEPTDWISKPGTCKVTYPNGNVFEGTYDDEKKKQGNGSYTWSVTDADEDEGAKNTAKYSGGYKDGKKDGLGKMKYPNGDKYHGMWEQNKKHGEGTYIYASGDIYSGSWESDIKQGVGSYEFGVDGSQLIGTWEKGSFVEGKWQFKDGGYYEGVFKDGKPTDKGMFKFANGSTLAGSFKEDKKIEDGEEVTSTYWKGGKLLTSNGKAETRSVLSAEMRGGLDNPVKALLSVKA